jgi:hypothetical protein
VVEAIRSSETSVLIRATRCHLPEDDNHHSHRRGNLKSYTDYLCFDFYKILTRVEDCVCLIRWVLDGTIGFIDILYTPVGTTDSDSVTAILHALQFTVTQALEFSAFTSRIQATDF